MAKKGQTVSDLVQVIKDDIALMGTSSGYIPDIFTFVYNEAYLGFADRNPSLKLYPVQELILKVFYRGSIGNEHLELTQDDINFCEKLGLNTADKGDLISKWNSGNLFKELVLVWGRRSGKDFLGSIIALYEALKLIESPGGNPHAYYSVAPGGDIVILTVANSQDQATVAFDQIKEKMLSSPYFADKFIPDGFQKASMRLMTAADKAENKKRKAKKLTFTPGSVVIEVGHSNSDTLRGKSCFVLLLDEVAMFKQSGGSGSGDVIYQSLRPSMRSFVRQEEQMDEDGNLILDDEGHPVTKPVYDAKIVAISTPRGEEGLFYKLYSQGHEKKASLICRLPTWVVNPNHTEESLREEESAMSEEEFAMEFGAQFSGTAGENMFPRDAVEKCFNHVLQIKAIGEPGRIYFAHLDPASTSHNYALVVVHRELFLNRDTKKTDFRVIVDHIKYWQPMPDQPIKVSEIDEYMIQMKHRFHFGLVTYDHWNSQSSILKLRKHGIAAKETRFTKNYKTQIYDELYNLIVSDRIWIPPHKLLKNEMIHLQRRFTEIGYKVFAPSAGEVHTDDLCDALAGAAYTAVSSHMHKLPASRLVNTGISPQSNERLWQSMSGPIGYGTGQNVSNELEKRDSMPFYRK